MTSKQYLKRKNKIVKRVTGKALIPKSQIKKHPFVKLDETLKHKHNKYEIGEQLLGGICTYCKLYDNHEPDCLSCPMAQAENGCTADIYSTWHIANKKWEQRAKPKDVKELMDLVEQYNKEEGKKC